MLCTDVCNCLLPTVGATGSCGLGVCEEYYQLTTAHWPGPRTSLPTTGTALGGGQTQDRVNRSAENST